MKLVEAFEYTKVIALPLSGKYFLCLLHFNVLFGENHSQKPSIVLIKSCTRSSYNDLVTDGEAHYIFIPKHPLLGIVARDTDLLHRISFQSWIS